MAKDEGIDWITVNGAHIPIKEGQSKDEAIRDHFGAKEHPTESDINTRLDAMDRIMTPEKAANLKEKGEIPEGWFVHGRQGSQEIKEGFPTLFSNDWNVAEGYAGEKGSMWIGQPKSEEDIFDATDVEACDKLSEKFLSDYEKGNLDYGNEQLAKSLLSNNKGSRNDAKVDFDRSLNPRNIVNSAEYWDGGSEMNWFYETTGKTFIKTRDGAVGLPGGNMRMVRVPK